MTAAALPAARRPHRDDALIALAGLAGGLLLWSFGLASTSPLWTGPRWLVLVPLVAMCAAALLRRLGQPYVLILAVLAQTADVLLGSLLATLVLFSDVFYAAALYGSARVSRRVVYGSVVFTVVFSTTLLAVFQRAEVLLIMAVAVGVTAMPAWTGVLIRGHRDTAAAERLRAEQTALLAEMDRTQAINAERTRMARELHDVVANHLSAIAIHSTAALSLPTYAPEPTPTTGSASANGSAAGSAAAPGSAPAPAAASAPEPASAPAESAPAPGSTPGPAESAAASGSTSEPAPVPESTYAPTATSTPTDPPPATTPTPQAATTPTSQATTPQAPTPTPQTPTPSPTEAAIREALGVIRENSVQGLAEMRRLIGLLREAGGAGEPTAAPSLDGLEALLERARATAGGDRTFTLDDRRAPGEKLPAPVELAAYRVIQEAVTNALKHAASGPVTVELTGPDDPEHPGALRIRVVSPYEDVRRDRRGPDDTPRAPGAGAGLIGMRERVDLLRGELSAGPVAAPPHGTGTGTGLGTGPGHGPGPSSDPGDQPTHASNNAPRPEPTRNGQRHTGPRHSSRTPNPPQDPRATKLWEVQVTLPASERAARDRTPPPPSPPRQEKNR